MSPSKVALASTILLSTGCALLLETNRSSPAPVSDRDKNAADWNIFFISGAAADATKKQQEDRLGRVSMASKGFGTPKFNVFSIWHKASKKKDARISVEAGTYSKQGYLGEWWSGVEFPYKGLSGAEYQKNSNYWLGHWNKWQTKNQFKKTLGDLCTNIDRFPEPTEEEAKTGSYRPGKGYKDDGRDIYQINYYYVPQVMETNKPGAHNGILIISSHGNMKGEITIDGAMKADALDDLIRDGYGSAMMPHIIVILSCGAGQGEGMTQELAYRTRAAVFVSKFIVGRSASLPQMTWGLSGGDPTEWALRQEFGLDGDPLHIGRTFCGKLGLEFDDADKRRWEEMKEFNKDDAADGFVSYFDVGLMNRDPYYFTWSNKDGDKGLPDKWVEDCKSRWLHTIPPTCRNPAPGPRQACAIMRAKNKKEDSTKFGELDTHIPIANSVFGPTLPADADPGIEEWVNPKAQSLPTEIHDCEAPNVPTDVPISTDCGDLEKEQDV